MIMSKMKRNEVTTIILSVIAAAGLLAVAVAMPGIIKLLPKNKSRKLKMEYYVSSRIQQLVRQKLIVYKNGKMSLSTKGELELEKHTHKKYHGSWDKKWRIVIFDVWETNRRKRDQLRQEIKQYGFVQLQRSVWIYPYPCEQFISLLKAYLHFGNNIRYMTLASIDDDRDIRKKFHIS